MKLPKKQVFVKPNEKRVIAKYSQYPDVPYFVIGEFNNKMERIILKDIECVCEYTNYENPYFTSVSECVDDDEFNEELGRDIAAEKVDMKFHVSAAKRCEVYINYLENMINNLKQIQAKHDKKTRAIYEDLQRIGGLD